MRNRFFGFSSLATANGVNHVGAQRVSIAVPQGKTVKGVKLLIGGQTPSFTQTAGRVNLSVPSIVVNEVVALDF